jgi:hypothetical protein
MLCLFTLTHDVPIDCACAISVSGLVYFPVQFDIFLAVEFVAIFLEDA